VLNKTQDDESIMGLVEQALARSPNEREAYVRSACAADPELFNRVWHYVQWEQRMNGFLLDPLYPSASDEYLFDSGEILEGRFRIVRKVAEGGMGVVYEAVDEKLERRIALKCGKLGFRKRLPPEVRNATEISHPNVCKIFEIHTASTRNGEIDFLTMEFLEGETLAERLRGGPLPEAEARTIARQLCAGLAEAHRNNVIHGDLKANNVILTAAVGGTMRAVITDFGLARRPAAPQGTLQSGEAGGTPGYMAPELWKGGPASVASDIYALGIILFELISGRRPFEPDLPAPSLSPEESVDRKPPPVNPRWDRILVKCLDPDPAGRFRDVEQVAEALAPGRTRQWLLVAAAAAVLAIGSGFFTYERAKAPQESVRLAMLPFQSGHDTASLSDGMFREAAAQLAPLKGSAHTKLTIVPSSAILQSQADTPEKARALLGVTHVLRATLGGSNENIVLQASLTDTRSGVNIKDWQAEYTSGELRYAAAALAGLVTKTLRIPPPVTGATVNAAAQSDYSQGLTYLRRDSGINTALSLMERAVAADPDSALTHAGLAEAEWFKYHLTNDKLWLDRSTESERQAERRNPDPAPVHRIAGLLLAASGRYEQAEAEYLRAIELDPDNGDAYRRLGMAYQASNRFDEALGAYKKAIQVQPDYFKPYQNLGDFYFQRANYNEAINPFRKAVELAPDEPVLHFALGTTWANLGRFAEAESELRSTVQLRETPDALEALGKTLMYESREREAIPYFLSALKFSPRRILSWMELGNCYRRTKQVDEAERANRRGLELAETELARNPRDGRVRAWLAYLCARLGDRQRAESEIAQALQLASNGPLMRGQAAVTYEALGLRDATLSVLSDAPPELLADLSRWPDLADLQKDSRFSQLVASHHTQMK
jgi:serine/threonine protein kinase/Flp pilus assembly protein TadD